MFHQIENDKKQNHAYLDGFKYTNSNPYGPLLTQFNKFVFRDEQGEAYQGKWAQDVFKNDHPLVVEIGSGYGHFMMQYCEKYPNINYVGLDYRFKRSFQLAKKLSAHPTQNFRYLRAKGERVAHLFGPNEVEKLFYFFPDPWPKTRHHKKRLFQPQFLKLAYQVLAPGGEMYVKTDHVEYFEWMLKALEQQRYFNISLQTSTLWDSYADHPLCEFKTKFEKIFLGQGHDINALVLKSQKV